MRNRLSFPLIVIVTLVGGCRDTTGPGGLRLDGNWNYQFSATGTGGTCSAAGSLTFRQSGAMFKGELKSPVTCTQPKLGFTTAEPPSAIHSGVINDLIVEFTIVLFSLPLAIYTCEVEVPAATAIAGQMSGPMYCGQDLYAWWGRPDITGTWTATR